MTKEMYDDLVKILKRRNRVFIFFIVLLSVVLIATTVIAVLQLKATIKEEDKDTNVEIIQSAELLNSPNNIFSTGKDIIEKEKKHLKDLGEDAKKYIIFYVSAALCGLFVIIVFICIFVLVKERIKLHKYMKKRKNEKGWSD